MHCGYILVQCTFCGYILVAYLVVIGNKLLSAVHFVIIFLYTASKIFVHCGYILIYCDNTVTSLYNVVISFFVHL